MIHKTRPTSRDLRSLRSTWGLHGPVDRAASRGELECPGEWHLFHGVRRSSFHLRQGEGSAWTSEAGEWPAARIQALRSSSQCSECPAVPRLPTDTSPGFRSLLDLVPEDNHPWLVSPDIFPWQSKSSFHDQLLICSDLNILYKCLEMHLNYLPLQAHIVLLNSKYHAHFSFPTYYIYIYFFSYLLYLQRIPHQPALTLLPFWQFWW